MKVELLLQLHLMTFPSLLAQWIRNPNDQRPTAAEAEVCLCARRVSLLASRPIRDGEQQPQATRTFPIWYGANGSCRYFSPLLRIPLIG